MEGSSVKPNVKYHAFYIGDQLQSRRWGLPGLATLSLNSAVKKRKENSKM